MCQGLARKLGINLPDPPTEETTTDAEIKTFILKQSEYVKECLTNRANSCIKILYHAGYEMTFLNALLLLVCHGDSNVTQRVTQTVRNLETYAKLQDINISEELSKVKNTEQLKEEDIAEIDRELRMKLMVKCKRPENKRSEIDPTRIITKEYWAVSLVRLPDSSHSQHAFLVLEGKSDNKSMIWFIDFVANDESDLVLPGMRDGKVREDYHESKEVPGSPTKLLFQCRKKMMEIHSSDRLLCSTWQIPKSAAQTLMLNIQAWKTKPPKYNVLGNSALAASSAASSSNTTSHNCFNFVIGCDNKHYHTH